MSIASSLTTAFPQLPWQEEYPLGPKTYFKIGGPAEVYLELRDRQQVSEVVRFCSQEGIALSLLGGASNVIVADAGVRGLVLHLKNEEITPLIDESGSTIGMVAGAGAKMSLVVSQMLKLGLTGLEYFLGVPGTVGGAVFNNAHYLSDLISQHIARVQVIDRQTGLPTWISHSDCDFSYDHSRFQSSHEIIWEVAFSLSAGEPEKSRELIKVATEYRAQTQPLGEPSSGCIFQNVPNTDHLRQLFPQFAERTHVPGGFLIDQAGLKGAREGDVEVSHKHAAFMINKGHGKSEELQRLVERVKRTVKAKFDVDLQEEVFYLQ